ncbi:MAG: adenylate cyclase [Hyphomicrobiaceae bacterium]|jgi:adenylate cyclase
MANASETNQAPIRTKAELSGMSGWERSARLWSGLILFTFVLMHFLNLAVGIFGVATMEYFQLYRTSISRSTVGSIVLYGAAIVHLIFVLKRIIGRRTWRMPMREALQIALGLAIPFLLYEHAIGTRYVSEFGKVNDAYGVTLQHLWPGRGYRQTALMLVVWMHGIIGINYSMRLQPWYPRVREPFLIVSVIIPALAIAGYISAGREAVALANPDARWTGDQVAIYKEATWYAYYIILSIGAALGLTIGSLALMRRFGRRIPIRYVGHGGVALPRGSTLLETSRSNNIPHPSVCGGRARCSTCRVLVMEGSETLPLPGPSEKALLERISAPPKVRLACQIRPTHPILVQILLPVTANGHSQSDWADEAYDTGAETVATVLFIDLRAFTELTKTQFPYDLVALLNRYMSEIQQATEAHGGKATMYLSDGMMAVFGLGGERGSGSRAAIAAARDMVRAIEAMNSELHAAMPIPLRIGIGVHTGPIVLGRIGDEARGYKVTAFGETVTIASRLEEATKRHLTDCLISQETLKAAGAMSQTSSRHEILIPGRNEAVIGYGLEKQAAAAEVVS